MPMAVPTLSTAGFLEDPAQKLDKILSYFFVADKSQSNVHDGLVSSLPYIIKEYSHNVNQLVNETQNAIIRMLNASFDECTVTVRVEDSKENGNEYNMFVEATVISDRKDYTLYRLVSVANETISKVSEFYVK